MMAHLTSEEKTKGVVTCSAGTSLPTPGADKQGITHKESLLRAKRLVSLRQSSCLCQRLLSNGVMSND